MAEPVKNKKVIRRLRSKFGLVVINDDTFEELLSLVLSPLNIFTVIGVSAILFAVLIVSLIAFTPVREFIPGYSDLKTKQLATFAAFKADSLEVKLSQNEKYIENLRKILNNEPTNNFISDVQKDDTKYDTIKLRKSYEDSLLREKVENEDRFNVMPGLARAENVNIGSVFFFPPVSGMLTSSFNPSINHFGVDIAGNENEVVKAALDGTVIISTWSSEDGYVTQIQHKNDLISVYKHNSTLLKKSGEAVKSGEAIAIIGNSGENSTGAHLHFEIWHKGVALDPQNFIQF